MSATTTEVRERPILFSGEMVRAILDGRKTQTRRVMKPQPMPHVEALRDVPFENRWWPAIILNDDWGTEYHRVGHEPPSWACPFGKAGDCLWVRESHYVWSAGYRDGAGRQIVYRATEPDAPNTWTPSIHMPRFASRITLEVMGVRVERVQDISEDDARAEGCAGGHDAIPGYAFSATPREHFHHTWNVLNAKRGYGWAANPWVWVVEFRVIPACAAQHGSRE